jgi:hypothetical protein
MSTADKYKQRIMKLRADSFPSIGRARRRPRVRRGLEARDGSLQRGSGPDVPTLAVPERQLDVVLKPNRGGTAAAHLHVEGRL